MTRYDLTGPPGTAPEPPPSTPPEVPPVVEPPPGHDPPEAPPDINPPPDVQPPTRAGWMHRRWSIASRKMPAFRRHFLFSHCCLRFRH